MGRPCRFIGLSFFFSALLIGGAATSSSADISSPTEIIRWRQNLPLELKRQVTQEGSVSGMIRWSGELGHPDRARPYCDAFTIHSYQLKQGVWVGAGVAKIVQNPNRPYECSYQVIFMPTGVPVRIDASYNGRWKTGLSSYAGSVSVVTEEGVNPIFTIDPNNRDVFNINFKPRISVRID